MTLNEIKKSKQGCPCEEVVNKACCEWCGYLNQNHGWECRYCENLGFDLKWKDKYACRHAQKAMHDYENGDVEAFYNAKK